MVHVDSSAWDEDSTDSFVSPFPAPGTVEFLRDAKSAVGAISPDVAEGPWSPEFELTKQARLTRSIALGHLVLQQNLVFWRRSRIIR